jgi:hypothetical protein
MGTTALDTIPGKHRKSAEVVERKEDALRSGAKERKRVKKRAERQWHPGVFVYESGSG